MKKIIAIFAVVLCLTLLLCLTACDDKTTEQPLPAETKQIGSVEDLVGLKNYLGVKYKNFVFELTSDIDLSGIERWEPIGSDLNNPFMGKLDGKGHSIKNLTVKGVDEDEHTPLFVAKDKGVEFVTSFASYGLFGFASGASFTDLTLENVNFDYYVDYQGFSYAAALVGFNVGASTFDGIDVSGSISVSNLYRKYIVHHQDDTEGLNNLPADECTTALFLGGIVGNSQGASVFNDVHSDIVFGQRYSAYYRTRENADHVLLEDDEVPFVEGYVLNDNYQNAHTKLEKIIAGGIAGQIKGGTITDATFGGSFDLNARSVYAAGIAGTTYETTVSQASVSSVTLTTKAFSGKNLVGGLVADLDDLSVLSNSSAQNSTLSATRTGSVLKITAGGAVGYAVSLSKIKDVAVSDLIVTVSTKDSAVGGLAGVSRDAVIEDSVASAVAITCKESSKEYDRMGYVIGEAEGDTSVKNVHATVTVAAGNGVPAALTKAIGTEVDSAFFNEDGKPAIRFYKDGTHRVYLTVDGEIDGNTLTINVYTEELTLLTTAVYTFDAPLEVVENPALTYMDRYFEQGVGFKNDVSGAVTIEGRDMTKYVYRAGKVVVENVDNVIPENPGAEE